jgi:hypothetical protein
LCQLPEAHQWFAADDREVEWLEAIDHLQNTIDQILTAIVGQRAERSGFLEVPFFVGIASRAAERTLSRDLDGE